MKALASKSFLILALIVVSQITLVQSQKDIPSVLAPNPSETEIKPAPTAQTVQSVPESPQPVRVVNVLPQRKPITGTLVSDVLFVV